MPRAVKWMTGNTNTNVKRKSSSRNRKRTKSAKMLAMRFRRFQEEGRQQQEQQQSNLDSNWLQQHFEDIPKNRAARCTVPTETKEEYTNNASDLSRFNQIMYQTVYNMASAGSEYEPYERTKEFADQKQQLIQLFKQIVNKSSGGRRRSSISSWFRTSSNKRQSHLRKALEQSLECVFTPEEIKNL